MKPCNFFRTDSANRFKLDVLGLSRKFNDACMSISSPYSGRKSSQLETFKKTDFVDYFQFFEANKRPREKINAQKQIEILLKNDFSRFIFHNFSMPSESRSHRKDFSIIK